MSEFDTYTAPGERKIANRLIRVILSSGGAISVNDGEEWTVKRSTDAATIRAAIATTGEDYLRAYDATGERLGTFTLIWGNDPSGDELIADHTDNEACDALYRAAHGEA